MTALNTLAAERVQDEATRRSETAELRKEIKTLSDRVNDLELEVAELIDG